jgi:hypothetical protein
MYLPPEVERLVPALLARVGGEEAADTSAESARIEELLLAGDPSAWLDYVRERGELVVAIASRTEGGDPPSGGDLSRLAGILRDQLALIQASIDLGPSDVDLLARLEAVEEPR